MKKVIILLLSFVLGAGIITAGKIAASENSSQFIWPVKDVQTITSTLGMRWGRFHPGIDIPKEKATPVYAALAGKVISTSYQGGYGLTITIEHRDNLVTRYAHVGEIIVKEGEFVRQGQQIGIVGSTGNSTGYHLHFEIRCNGIPMDPLDFLPQRVIDMPMRMKSYK